MSATAENVESIKTTGLKANETMISGKVIKTVSLPDGGRITTVITPAPSEFEHPQTIGIRSKNQLGQKDDIIKQRCKVAGRIRTFTYTDKNSGAREQGENYDIFLHAVE